jgi:hypothetical protein
LGFYVATTYDRGAHWVTVNATAGEPVQKGSICLLGVICGTDRNLLDFNDIAVDREGRSIAAYADGCVPANGCVAPDYTGRDRKASIVRQLTGRRLFAAFDPVTPVPTPTPSNVQLLNISGRVLTQGGDKVGIGGFIITGTSSKSVIVRAIGPSLTVNGAPVPGRLDDPKLELRASDGHLIAANDSWRSTQEQEIQQSGLAPSDNREAAIIASLPAGQYTAIISGANNSSGLGVVEVYNLESTLPGELGNLAVRGDVKTGDNVLISGLILGGATPKRVLLRAIGPSLQSQLGNAVLQDPVLELHDGNGATMATNDNWKSASNANEIQATGLAPNDDRESAILMPLSAGSYTTIVRGVNNTTGIAVAEAYKLNN